MDVRFTSDADGSGAGLLAARHRPVSIAAIAWAATLAVFAPGYAMYDTLTQYAQAASGAYDDWHPPVMARLWSLFDPTASGAAAMFALQVTGYWIGIAMLADALVRSGRRTAAWCVIGIALWPPFLGWQVAVLKDAQMVAALLAGTALIVAPRLTGRPVRGWRWVLAALLFAYASLVRANAIFAVAPLVAMLLPLRWPMRAGGAVGLVALVLAISPTINHRLLGAAPTGVERTQAIFDLAGIAVRAPDADAGLSKVALAHIVARGCVRPFFWDPLGDTAHCANDVLALQAIPAGTLYRMLALQAAAHPLAYLAQRLSHLNSTERWLVPWGWPSASPPDHDEPNTLGLREPGSTARLWQHVGDALVEMPLGWPICYVALGLLVIVALGADGGAAASAGRALIVSGLTLEASFAAISIASDWRYHLWPMLAIALGSVIAAPRVPRNMAISAALAMGVVLIPAIGARIVLMRAPATYQAMLG